MPIFVPSFRSPAALARFAPPAQLAFLVREARLGGAREKLLYGVALQRLGRQLSARREYEAAAALAPDDPEPQVAVAVASFDKAAPAGAFARLGPLSRTYPRSQSVRFHVGLLLLWLGRVEEARQELRTAKAVDVSSLLGREATRFLTGLSKLG